MGLGGDTLPPLVQEYRANADQLLETQDKIKDSTRDMADETESSGKRQSASWVEVAKGTVVGKLAYDALKAAMRGLEQVIGTGIQEAKDASAINAQLAAGIASTGNAAGVTVEGMNALASSIQAYSGQTDDSIGKTQSLLLTFTNIKNVGVNRVFDDATRAAADMAARLGGDAASQAMILGKALNDPIAGISALTRVGVTFSQQQKDQIATMVAAGDVIGAQGVILENLQTQFGGSAEAAGQTFPGAIERAKRAFEDLAQGVVEKFVPVITPAILGAVDLFQRISPVAEAVAGHIADAFAAIGPAIDIVKGAFTGLGSDADLGPLNGALETFGQTLATVADMAKPILKAIMDGFEQLAPVFAPIIGQVVELWAQFSPLMLVFQALGPVLPDLINSLVTLGVTLGGVLGEALTTLLPIISQIAGMLAGQLANIIVTLAPIVVKLASSLGGLLASALTAIMPFVLQLAEFIGSLLQAVLPLIDPILQLVMAFLPLLDPIIQLVTTLLGPLVDLLSMVLDPVLKLVSALVSFLAPAIEVIVAGLADNLIPIIDAVVSILGGLIDFVVGVFTGNWDKAWRGVVQIFVGIWDGIKGVVRGAINGVIDLINGIIAGVNGIAGSIKDATGGAININIGRIPRVSFDTGTDRVPGVKGAALAAIIHGGEAIASNDMIDGREPMPPRIVEAVQRQQGGGGTTPSKGATYVDVGGIHVQTNASAQRIARELGWVLEREG